METTTARLGLPLIVPGQAQKELAHNEALTLIDMLLHPAVEGGPRDAPPAAPTIGQCWIVGAAPTGPWAGQADALAAWTESGWRFARPQPAMVAWDVAGGAQLRFAAGTGWIAAETIAPPAGGGTVDVEARATLAQLLQALRQQGLVDR